MKKQFEIFKDGVTADWVQIVSKEGEDFDKPKKIAKYLSLGYKIR